MIFDFLEKLQDKPKRARQQILWAAVFVCMVIILALWVFSFKHSLKRSSEQPAKTNLIPDEIGSSVQQMQSEWQDIKNRPSSNLPNVFENQEGTENPFEQ
jgi:hypothetical protein